MSIEWKNDFDYNNQSCIDLDFWREELFLELLGNGVKSDPKKVTAKDKKKNVFAKDKWDSL
jgi:hypothetical protein